MPCEWLLLRNEVYHKKKKIGFSRHTCADWLNTLHSTRTNTIVSVSLFKLVSRILYKYKTFSHCERKSQFDYGLPIEKYNKSSVTAIQSISFRNF